MTNFDNRVRQVVASEVQPELDDLRRLFLEDKQLVDCQAFKALQAVTPLITDIKTEIREGEQLIKEIRDKVKTLDEKIDPNKVDNLQKTLDSLYQYVRQAFRDLAQSLRSRSSSRQWDELSKSIRDILSPLLGSDGASGLPALPPPSEGGFISGILDIADIVDWLGSSMDDVADVMRDDLEATSAMIDWAYKLYSVIHNTIKDTQEKIALDRIQGSIDKVDDLSKTIEMRTRAIHFDVQNNYDLLKQLITDRIDGLEGQLNSLHSAIELCCERIGSRLSLLSDELGVYYNDLDTKLQAVVDSLARIGALVASLNPDQMSFTSLQTGNASKAILSELDGIRRLLRRVYGSQYI